MDVETAKGRGTLQKIVIPAIAHLIRRTVTKYDVDVENHQNRLNRK
jgi:hypothetical protein